MTFIALTDHAYYPRNKDAETGKDAEPRYTVERTREGANSDGNGEYASVEHEA